MPEFTGESIMPGESTSMMFLRFRSLRTCTKGVRYVLQLLASKNVRANEGQAAGWDTNANANVHCPRMDDAHASGFGCKMQVVCATDLHRH